MTNDRVVSVLWVADDPHRDFGPVADPGSVTVEYEDGRAEGRGKMTAAEVVDFTAGVFGHWVMRPRGASMQWTRHPGKARVVLRRLPTDPNEGPPVG